MSSFSDTFTRDENKETQYDDSAFYSFAGTILLVTILPLLWAIMKRIFFSKELLNKKNFKNCECKTCGERITKHYRKIRRSKLNFTFYFMIVMVILLSYLFYLSYFEIVKNGNNFKRFDPFEILEIEPGADEKEIKKAYRRLILIFHPDKNPNNLQAKAKFIMIAKAYESLTDEVAKKNFELYGNPDGPGSMRLAVGLPSFVLNKKNHMPILFLFLLLIIVIIPGFVWFWFSNSSKYDESGMLLGNQKIFYDNLNENILLKQLPFVLGLAVEYSSMKVKQEQTAELIRIWKQFKDHMPKHKEEEVSLSNRKAICLIYGYLNNHEFASPGLNEELDEILKSSPMLISNMYTCAIECTKMHMMNKMIKNFGYNCVKAILEFSQIIHQQMSYRKDEPEFLQIPHFNEAKIQDMKLYKNKANAEVKKKLNNFVVFIQSTPEERLPILTELHFDVNQIFEIEICLKTFPKYELKVECFVEGFEEILLEDFLTIKITINRLGLEDNIELGVSHSKRFPELFKEKVVVLIKLGENRIVFEAVLDIDKNVTTHEFKHMAREVGKFAFEVELIPFNFKGLDEKAPLVIEVLKSSEKRENFIKAIEKKEIKKLEPSLFQQMINQVLPINNDDDEEEEEEEGAEKENKENNENDENTENKEGQEATSEDPTKPENDKKEENKLIDEPNPEDKNAKKRKNKKIN